MNKSIDRGLKVIKTLTGKISFDVVMVKAFEAMKEPEPKIPKIIENATIRLEMKCPCQKNATIVIEQDLYDEISFTCCLCGQAYSLVFKKGDV